MIILENLCITYTLKKYKSVFFFNQGNGKEKLIIDATIELINKFGFANFSVGKVANKINVSKGGVTYHFPTKESLLQSVVVSYYENASKYMEQHIRLDKDAVNTLNSYIESCLYFADENKKQTEAIREVKTIFELAKKLYLGNGYNGYIMRIE